MRKERLYLFMAAVMLFWAGALSAFGNNRKEIHFNVEKIDPTVGMPPAPKMPPRAPVVYVEDNVLYFEGDHPAYVLNIEDANGNLVYTVEIAENATEVTLPTTLIEDFCVKFIQGSWCIYGRIAPDGYRPMVVDGKIWKGYEVDKGSGKRYQCDYFIDGDTLLQGKKYLKCYYNSERMGATPRYMGALYEENGKVYGVQPRYNDAGLVFDFNMQVGDSVFCLLMGSFDSKTFSFLCDPPGLRAIDENGIEYSSYMKLAKIETIQNGEGIQLRRYHLDLYRLEFDHGKRIRKLPDTIYWIEGIGVENNYPLSPWSLIMESSCKYELEECCLKNNMLYSRAKMTSLDSCYRPMVVDGKIWKGTETDATGKRYQCDYYIDGDTLLNGKVYYKCFSYSERIDVNNSEKRRYIGALQEIDRKVFGVPATFDDKHLLYDFSMEVGDSVYCHMSYSPATYQGMSHLENWRPFWAIDYLSGRYSDEYYFGKHSSFIKLQNIESADNGIDSNRYDFLFDICYEAEGHQPQSESRHLMENVHWLEGVGEENGYPFRSWDLFGHKNLMYDRFQTPFSYQLEECSVQDKLLYSRAGTTGIVPVQTTTLMPVSDAIYDLQGRRLYGEPCKGIYIRNGRKVVKK